ncbi:hypothetical protein DV872_23425 [Oceanispirochaeta sp. M1]|nr:hypothetical protein DV872_23425 [Oceanispirochaeta sp. M1]
MKAKNHLMLCRMSDESVVVIKFRPVKASNGLEDKTGMTLHLIVMGCWKCQKRQHLRRDEVQKKIIGGL